MLSRPTAILLASCFVLANMPMLIGRSFAVETEDAVVAAATDVGIATLCRFLLGSGKLAAIEVQPSGDEISAAMSDDAGKLYVSRGRGGQWTSRIAQLDLSQPPRLRLVDLDGDGEYELIVVSKRLQIYSTVGGIRQLWSSPELFDDVRPPAVDVLDFDRDGRHEIVVLNYKRRERPAEEASIFVFRQDAPSEAKLSLICTMTLRDEHDYHSTAGLAIGDFAGTGVPQLVVGNDNGFLWWIEFRDDRLNLRHEWKVPWGGAVGTGLAAGDLDGRSGAELLVGTNGGDLFVFGFELEGAPKLRASAKAGRLAYGVTAGDFDGDGRLEFGLARGNAGYAGMTERDVVAEVWRLDGEQLRRVWQCQTLDAPRAIWTATVVTKWSSTRSPIATSRSSSPIVSPILRGVVSLLRYFEMRGERPLTAPSHNLRIGVLMMRSPVAYLIVAVLVAVAGSFAWNITARAAYESAEYTVLESDGPLEIREYPDLMLVTTHMRLLSQGSDGSFMRLFRYISGGNEAEQKVAMTTPVFMAETDETTSGRMSFVIPKDVVSQGVPKPSGDDVQIRKREGGRFGVLRFAGRMDAESAEKAEERLKVWLEEKGLRFDGEAEFAGYDPPWTPGPLRRNEVLLRLQGNAESPLKSAQQ